MRSVDPRPWRDLTGFRIFVFLPGDVGLRGSEKMTRPVL